MAKPDFPEAHDAPRDAQTIISALQSLRSTQASALSGRSDVDHASRVLQAAMRAGWIAANPVPEKAGDKEMGAALDGGATPAGQEAGCFSPYPCRRVTERPKHDGTG
jgi:hypothetical protein